MTTINSLDDFLRALDANPSWREAVRARILGEELLQLPVKFDAFAQMKDRQTGQITSQVVESTDAGTLQDFVRKHTGPDTMVYTDEARAYVGLNRPHESVKHSVSEFVRGMAHTNGMESHWAALKRGYALAAGDTETRVAG